jgi:hypothetical protein
MTRIIESVKQQQASVGQDRREDSRRPSWTGGVGDTVTRIESMRNRPAWDETERRVMAGSRLRRRW